MLPEQLQENIYKIIEDAKLKNLSFQSQQLTTRYREGKEQYMETEGHRFAYLLTRMPATYAAIVKVLMEVIQRAPTLSLHSFLDLGAGPGTGMWAVKEIFPQILRHTLLEKDPHLISLGKRLSAGKEKWVQGDLEKMETFDSHDLVLLSYALGELKKQEEVAYKAWKSAEKLLMIIEPGTPLGFSRLKKVREYLLGLGAHLIAPCPHAFACPLKENDWCHFSVRLSRTSLHRQMKGGDLGYEDEKFFYLVFSKTPSISRCQGRVLRHPQKHPGFVEMSVCTDVGVQRKVFSRKEKENYKWARKKEWGDQTINDV